MEIYLRFDQYLRIFYTLYKYLAQRNFRNVQQPRTITRIILQQENLITESYKYAIEIFLLLCNAVSGKHQSREREREAT